LPSKTSEVFNFFYGATGKPVQQSDNYSDPFDVLFAASPYGLFQSLPFWSSYNLAIASVFRVS
jgi:hypothetical protein